MLNSLIFILNRHSLNRMNLLTFLYQITFCRTFKLGREEAKVIHNKNFSSNNDCYEMCI